MIQVLHTLEIERYIFMQKTKDIGFRFLTISHEMVWNCVRIYGREPQTQNFVDINRLVYSNNFNSYYKINE